VKDPKTIPEDIYRLLENETDHVVSEDNVLWAAGVFADLLRTRLKKREEKRGEEVLRFSSLGKPDRQMWYAANMPEAAEKMPGKQLFKFLYGDVIEVLLLFLTKESGHEVTHLQHSVEVDGVRGSMDAVIDGVPADCKSASPYGYKKFEDGTIAFDDAFGYIPQLSGYSHAVEKTDRAGFLAAEKVAGDICWSEIDSYTIEGNPPGPKIAHQREVVNRETPPERCYPDVKEGASGNRKLGIGCSYCAWRDECWKDANGGQGLKKYIYARGPVWLTHVVREPRVEAA
jgi:hypothetical protein